MDFLLMTYREDCQYQTIECYVSNSCHCHSEDDNCKDELNNTHNKSPLRHVYHVGKWFPCHCNGKPYTVSMMFDKIADTNWFRSR